MIKFDAEKYEDLKPWMKKAFDLLFNKKLTGHSVSSVAKEIGKSRQAVSAFYNSECYKNIAVKWTQMKFRDLNALALDAAGDILTDNRVNVQGARGRMAMHILDETNKPDPNERPAGIGNLNIIFGDLKDLNLDKVRDMKQKLLKRIEGEFERTAEAGS